MPGWLDHAGVDLMVAAPRLAGYKVMPEARAPFAVDSGAYSVLQQYGEWPADVNPRYFYPRSPEETYVRLVRRCMYEIGRKQWGRMLWAASQDWPCDPLVISGGVRHGVRYAGTRLSVAEHQRRTVTNYLQLRDMAPEVPWVPPVQGWHRDEYLRCVDLYEAAGVDLAGEPLVGLGSLVGREGTAEIEAVVTELAGMGLRLHGFGVKLRGLRRYARYLVSADSQAWSAAGRRVPGCSPGHATEANCLGFALGYRQKILDLTA